jgi:hypothetical protein
VNEKTNIRISRALVKAQNPDLAPEKRLKGCDSLIKYGFVEQALPALKELANDPEVGGSARMLQRTGEYLLRRGLANGLTSIDGDTSNLYTPMISDEANTAYWRSPDPERAAESLVILFTGESRKFGISLDVLHRILRRSVGQVVYLRDHNNLFYLAGIHTWGDAAATLDRLKRLIAESSVKRVCAIGSSAGGFAALRFGLDLSVDAVLALSPQTDLRKFPEFKVGTKSLQRFRIPGEALDLLPLYEQAERRPQVTIAYGEDNKADEGHVKRLAKFAEVEILPLPGVSQHNVVTYLIAEGLFDQLVQKTLGRELPA